MKIKSIIASAALLLVMCTSAYAQDINVSLNGEIIDFSRQQPVVVDGRTLIPLRGIFDSMGYEIRWNGEDKSVSMYNGTISIYIGIGENEIYVNSESIPIDVPAQIINGTTMLPLRAVADATGAEVLWDAETKIVTIISADRMDNPQPVKGLVKVESKAEENYINSYTEIMQSYNEKAISFLNVVNDENASLQSIYSASQTLYGQTRDAIAKVDNLSVPSGYENLTKVTKEYMQYISDMAKLYIDMIDGNISIDEAYEKINSIGTMAMQKENEYQNAFNEILNR